MRSGKVFGILEMIEEFFEVISRNVLSALFETKTFTDFHCSERKCRSLKIGELLKNLRLPETPSLELVRTYYMKIMKVKQATNTFENNFDLFAIPTI